MSTLPTQLLAAFRQLPPLPQALVAAMQVIRDHRSQRSDLVRVLSLDQSLTGLFLRVVNSAYYGLPRRITSLDEAIGYLGYETVESMIFAMSAKRVLSNPVPAYMLERGMLWQHSVAVASGAQWIARERELKPVSDAYVAGLLHDVGKLVIDLVMEHRSMWDKGLKAKEEEGEIRAWVEIERIVTGHDHAEVGALLVGSWNLPEQVMDAVRHHHTPAESVVAPRLTAAVHLANAAALMAGVGLGIDGLFSSLDITAIELLEWDESDMEGLIGTMQRALSEAKNTLGI